MLRFFHGIAKLKTMQHKPSNLLSTIFPKLEKDENGFIKLNTLCFGEAIIARANRLNNPDLLKNLINQPNKHNQTPVMDAVEVDHLDILKLFFPYARLELRKEVSVNVVFSFYHE